MFPFFESTIRPLLDEIRPLRTVVEVGAEAGQHTNRLLPYLRARGAHLHVIDPVPRFEVQRYNETFQSCSTLHVGLSHDVLPSIEEPDVVMLDGDHNWYTVIEELRILDRRCTEWPVTFTHDIEWPYGRRDMYYAPQRVPEDMRQPYARSGIVEGRSELSPEGHNRGLFNALYEGGPRNGVLTAIEDFVRETPRDLVLFTAPGDNGLGIIVDRMRLRNARFAKLLRKAHDPRAKARAAPRASGAAA